MCGLLKKQDLKALIFVYGYACMFAYDLVTECMTQSLLGCTYLECTVS